MNISDEVYLFLRKFHNNDLIEVKEDIEEEIKRRRSIKASQ